MNEIAIWIGLQFNVKNDTTARAEINNTCTHQLGTFKEIKHEQHDVQHS